jgi:uncharacterized membrane protein YeaQ/YmgE (transglycosylase-associated protein family)
VIGFIIAMVITGAVVGGLARLAIPGPDPMTIGQTILVGIGGSLLAGIVVGVISGGKAAPGIVGSVLGATLIVYLVRRSRRPAA